MSTARPTRREARRLAILAVFAHDATGYPMDETIALLGRMNENWAVLPEFTVRLCLAVERHHEEIGVTLARTLEHWKLDRVAPVERAILKLACAEVDYFAEIPPRVTITEYLELAKLYTPDQAPGFINGVIDKLVQQRGKPDFEAGRTTRRAGH